MRLKKSIALGLFALAVAPATSFAGYLYSYTGNNFDQFLPVPGSSWDTNDFVTVAFELGSMLGPNFGYAQVTPLSFEISDGVQTLTSSSSNITYTFEFATDGSGDITEWLVFVGELFSVPTAPVGEQIMEISTYNRPASVVSDEGHVKECLSGGVCGGTETIDAGKVDRNAGAWSVSAVPVPATAWLVGPALFGLAAFTRRKRVQSV